MKIYLFGGSESKLGQFKPLYSLIAEEINKIDPQEVLVLTYAIKKIPFDKFFQKIALEWKNTLNPIIKVLDANNPSHLKSATEPLIFMSGGSSNSQLISKTNEKDLLPTIKNADYVIGESAGAMVLGTKLRDGETSELIKGFNLINNSIIEPHYTERDRHKLLTDEMKETGLKYGVGLDCVTGISFDLKNFPRKYQKIGMGLAEVKVRRHT